MLKGPLLHQLQLSHPTKVIPSGSRSPAGMKSKNLEKEYASYSEEIRGGRMSASLRSGILIVVGLYTPFLILDYFVYRSEFVALAGARISIALVLGAAYWLADRAPVLVTNASVLAVGFNLVAVIGIAGGVSSLYFPGVMLLFLGMPVLLPLSARQSGMLVGSIFLAFSCLPLFGAGTFGTREYFVNLFFPGAAAVEAVFSCALLDNLRFRDFCRTQEIAAARDELAKLDDAKTRFSANVHHELRTPLTLMIAPLEGIRGGQYGSVSTEVGRVLETMHSNGQRLLKLISNLLDLSKLENSQFSIVRAPVSLSDVLSELVDGTRPLAAQKGISLSSLGLDELQSVFVDRDAIDKVFMNLIGNALKFTGKDGLIRLEGENVEEGVELRVVDSGIGLAADQLDRIFDRFAQVDTSSTRVHEGTGIGLSLASELVALHEGRIWATSEGPGCGTTMHVFLPVGSSDSFEAEPVLVDALTRAAPTESNVGSAPADSSQERFVELGATVQRWLDQSESDESKSESQASIEANEERDLVLVVDDNADMRELLSHILSKEFSIVTARNGLEALKRLEEVTPLLVVTDVMMPEMNGTELCERIKSSESLRQIPVMIVSSKAESEMKVRGLELGADDYVTKPFHPREVLARARSLVQLRKAQHTIAQRNGELERALDELESAQSQLVQSERLAAVGELAAGIAHEVNNPLNFALNAARALRASSAEIADLLLADGEGGEIRGCSSENIAQNNSRKSCSSEGIESEIVELSDIVIQGLGRTEKLIGDLRDFAMPRKSEALSTIDIAEEVRSVVSLFQYEASRLGIEIECALPESPMLVQGDRGALGQVILNFLKNSAQAIESDEDMSMERPPTVRIAGCAGSGEVRVSVWDSGPGIPEDVQSRLFDPFFTTRDVGTGSGLGLSVCRGIAESHGGRIEVVSEVGEGSEFSLVLPVS